MSNLSFGADMNDLSGAAGLSELFRSIPLDLTASNHVAVAVSGGSDSVALMHLVNRWALLRGLSVTALTVDHGLRPGSGDEAVQVAQWAAAIGLEHKLLSWTGPKPRTQIQAKARQARYDLMTDWCTQNGVSLLMTGHTMNDQAETVAMRLQRSGSPESISAIRPVLDWRGVKVYRPLLKLKRAELQNFLRGQGLGWLDDPSNENRAFERVRTRQSLVDTEIEPMALRADVAQGQIHEISREIKFLSQNLRAFSEGYLSLERTWLTKPDAVVPFLHHVIDVMGGSVTERSERERLADWLSKGVPGRKTLGGVIFSLRQRDILFIREPGRIGFAAESVPVDGSFVWDGRFVIRAQPGTMVTAASRVAGVEPLAGVPRAVSDGLPAVVLKSRKPVLAHTLPAEEMSLTFPAKPLVFAAD
jgi:tRNA(Ile)-lysidine synthase